jgi:hypothetical protein
MLHRLPQTAHHGGTWCIEPANTRTGVSRGATQGCSHPASTHSTLGEQGAPRAAPDVGPAGGGTLPGLVERCGGLKVHPQTVAACVIVSGAHGRVTKEVRTCGPMTEGLVAVADGLAGPAVPRGAMASTGVSCSGPPVCNRLEGRVTRLLVTAPQLPTVAGRKTDVRDAVGIADLLRQGVLNARFLPDRPRAQRLPRRAYRAGQRRDWRVLAPW